jgi:hypothetical protein
MPSLSLKSVLAGYAHSAFVLRGLRSLRAIVIGCETGAAGTA